MIAMAAPLHVNPGTHGGRKKATKGDREEDARDGGASTGCACTPSLPDPTKPKLKPESKPTPAGVPAAAPASGCRTTRLAKGAHGLPMPPPLSTLLQLNTSSPLPANQAVGVKPRRTTGASQQQRPQQQKPQTKVAKLPSIKRGKGLVRVPAGSEHCMAHSTTGIGLSIYLVPLCMFSACPAIPVDAQG